MTIETILCLKKVYINHSYEIKIQNDRVKKLMLKIKDIGQSIKHNYLISEFFLL